MKNHKKHLNEHFHNIYILLGSVDFDVPNHAFFKSFKNVTLVIFLELFGQEQKFGIGFTIFLMIFFLR